MKWRDRDGVDRADDRKPGAGVRRLAATRAAVFWPARMLAVLHWYAVEARPGTEFAVEAILERRGFVAVVPMQTEYRRANIYVKRKTKRSYVIAPRYVLVGFSAAQLRNGHAPWHQVFSITMVQSVVGLDGKPWRMRGKETAAFVKAHALHDAPIEFEHMGMKAGREFKVGDTVQVMEGSLAGLRAKVASIEGPAAKVLLPLFGKADQEFPLKVSDLEPVDD